MGAIDLDDGLHDTLLDLLHTIELFIQNLPGLCRVDGGKITSLPLDIEHNGESALGVLLLLRADRFGLDHGDLAAGPV